MCMQKNQILKIIVSACLFNTDRCLFQNTVVVVTPTIRAYDPDTMNATIVYKLLGMNKAFLVGPRPTP